MIAITNPSAIPPIKAIRERAIVHWVARSNIKTSRKEKSLIMFCAPIYDKQI